MDRVLASIAEHINGRLMRGRALRPLILAAHQDDETIGASVLLQRVPGCTVVYLTDGAPRDPRLRSPLVTGSREQYAQLRAGEAAAALAPVNIPPSSIISLGGTDQEAINQWEMLLQTFSEVVRRIEPGVIVTHPYEGGHPDHDTAALIGRIALFEMDGAVPALLEMTSYHNRQGQLAWGEFHSESPADEEVLTVRLTQAEQHRKKDMLSHYRSQVEVLSAVPIGFERLRTAPAYDFTQPPHHDELWYELLDWPTSGSQWRELASEALMRAGEAQ